MADERALITGQTIFGICIRRRRNRRLGRSVRVTSHDPDGFSERSTSLTPCRRRHDRVLPAIHDQCRQGLAASDLLGMICTYVWALDDPEDKGHIDRLVDIFMKGNARICFVELEATQAERLHPE